ncbi:hypothetical protein [Kamptonema sp. UHCC 0994]|uniref:maleate cis-trans isomerase family protein n=1 Tax=Kamptonema sp. UHCC 0994 TaxID=3031329 RepID=UPI0023B967A1|nr:hypothetical protein [Kamptonema sp. UHCC 0994]MDF0551648.1 hypothetical protein [Kamptonema sp. UHCC 0994]
MVANPSQNKLKVESLLTPLSEDIEYQKQVRIGLIAISTDPTIEPDFRKMLNTDEVEFFVSRVLYENSDSPEKYWAIAERLTEATALLTDIPLDVIAYGCTSATVEVGVEKTFERIWAARPGIPCSTPITAACKGFKELGVNKIALLTPYPDEVTYSMSKYLELEGISVVKMASFKRGTDWEKSKISPSTICDVALEIAGGDAEGIFISCTALRATDAIEEIELRLGKPVISSNQALLWESLRLVGYKKPILGYGYLMRK